MQAYPKALLLGGTGAMGVYLSAEMVDRGYEVWVTSRAKHKNEKGISYIQGDAKNPIFLRETLLKHFDVVVDFMSWTTNEYKQVYKELLDSCAQYIFLSSYRVFADSPVVAEGSPQLIDVIDDNEYLLTDEYALAKSRQEKLLRDSAKRNWTIVRPVVTYSKARFQLCTLECQDWVPRALAGWGIPLPKDMLSKTAAMTWGGDAAKMISRLAGNPDALCEDYNLCTSKQNTWSEVASVYSRFIPLKIVEVSQRSYERAVHTIYQIRYDRMYDRVMDNSKVLAATNLREEDLKSIEDGLGAEFSLYLSNCRGPWKSSLRRQGGLDRLVGKFRSPKELDGWFELESLGYSKYLFERLIGAMIE